jgi:hypothetical protein
MNDYAFPDECDSYLQNCPVGEKCVPYGSDGGEWDAFKCVSIMGEQAPGEPCSYGGVVEASDDCDATSGCWNVQNVDGEPIGTCHLFCAGTPDDPVCPPGSSCTISGDESPAYCVAICDPVAQDCEPGLGCYHAGSTGFQCFLSAQNLPAGEPCGYLDDCAPGLVCLDASVLPTCNGAACCSTFCDLGLGDAQCDAIPGTSCVPFYQEGTAPPEYEHVGVCIVPGA